MNSEPTNSDHALLLSNRVSRKLAPCAGSGSTALALRSAGLRPHLLHATGLARDLWLVGRAVAGTGDDKRRSAVMRVRPSAGQVRRVQNFARRWHWCLVVAMLGLSRPAQAQAPEVVTPIDLFDPESGKGVTLGEKLMFFPRLEADGTYDSNIYNIDQGKVDDFFVSVRPRFVLRPDLARHGFEVSGGAEIRRHADISAEDSEQYDIGARARLDLAARTAVVIDGNYRHGIEQRGTAGDQFLTDSPVEYDRIEAGVVLKRTGGFLEMLGEARVAEIDYQDASLNGAPIDLSGRDASVRRARIRASAPSSDHTRIFFEGSVNQVRYENPGPLSRNSEGFAALVGMHLLLTELIDIEAGAGYIRQNFENPAIENVSDVNFHLLVDWTPRPDIAVTAAARRSVEPSPRVDVAALIRSDFSLEARKAVGDRLLMSAEVGLVNEKYQGAANDDQRFYASVGAHYRLTDTVGVIGRVGWRKQDGGSYGRDYNGVSATIGVRVHL